MPKKDTVSPIILWPYIEADFQREYGINLLEADDMSWRRFCALYSALSPQSQVCRHYDRAARRAGISDPAREAGAWARLTGLPKPGRRR